MLHSELIPAKETESRRLLIMLHGLADSIEGYRWLPELLHLDWLNYLLVNAPDEYYGGYSWYDFAGDPAPGVMRSCKLLSELLDSMVQKGYPAEDIVLGGFSQGCLMAIETGLRYPQRLAGIVGISGYISDLPKLKRELSTVGKQQRVLMSHGTQDPIIPFANVRKQAAELKAAGVDVEWHEFAKPHSIAGESEISIVRSFIKSCYK
jgi:phospholipase/carboxylesterase